MIHIWETLYQFLVLKDSRRANFYPIGSICIDIVVIWEVVLDVEEFLLDGTCFGKIVLCIMLGLIFI